MAGKEALVLRQLQGRLRWLASYPSELEDYISTRYADIATLDTMTRAVQDFGLKPGAQENLDKVVGPVVEQTLWWWTQYRNYLAARKKRPEALGVMAGLEDAGERFLLDVMGVA